MIYFVKSYSITSQKMILVWWNLLHKRNILSTLVFSQWDLTIQAGSMLLFYAIIYFISRIVSREPILHFHLGAQTNQRAWHETYLCWNRCTFHWLNKYRTNKHCCLSLYLSLSSNRFKRLFRLLSTTFWYKIRFQKSVKIGWEWFTISRDYTCFKQTFIKIKISINESQL